MRSPPTEAASRWSMQLATTCCGSAPRERLRCSRFFRPKSSSFLPLIRPSSFSRSRPAWPSDPTVRSTWGSCDETVEMCPATVLVREDVEDHERVRIAADREPRDGLRLVVDEWQRVAEELRKLFRLAGLRFKANDQSFGDHLTLLVLEVACGGAGSAAIILRMSTISFGSI